MTRWKSAYHSHNLLVTIITYWSALATATAETSAEAKEASIINIGPSVLRAPAEQTKVATVFGN